MDAVFRISHSFSLCQCQACCEEDCQFVLSHASQGGSFFLLPDPCVITAFEVLISEHFLLKRMNAAVLFPAIPAASAAPLEHQCQYK